MTHNLNYKDIKIDMQIIGFEMNDYIKQRIDHLIGRMKKFFPSANWIDIYLKYTKNQSTSLRKLRIRFAIPGPDLVAFDAGNNWETILKNVEKKLIRQVIKRKTTSVKNCF